MPSPNEESLKKTGLNDDEIRQSLIAGLTEFAQGPKGQPTPLPSLPVTPPVFQETIVKHEPTRRSGPVTLATSQGAGNLNWMSVYGMFNGGVAEVRIVAEFV